MTNVDLFEDTGTRQETLPLPPSEAAAAPAAAGRGRRTRPAGASSPHGERHYRLAMRAARGLPRSDRRDQTRRLICHHLRCMLDEDGSSRRSRR